MTPAALVTEIATQLRARGERLATAESCTGGLIAATCTDLAGSSDWFERGVVTYSNEAKQELLGVPKALIDDHGAVSAEVAEAMATGLLARVPSTVHWTIAVTGVAGPGGGSAEKPVGTVWLGLAGRNGALRVWCERFEGDRARVRWQTVTSALGALVLQLEQAS